MKNAIAVHNERTKALAGMVTALGIAILIVALIQPLADPTDEIRPMFALIGALVCCSTMIVLGDLRKEA